MASAPAAETRLIRSDDVSHWGYQPRWRARTADCEIDVATELAGTEPRHWLVFADETGLTQALVARLRDAGHRVSVVSAGDMFARVGEHDFLLAPERGREGYDELVRELMSSGHPPQAVVHAWLVTGEERFRPGSSFFHRNIEQGFFSLLFLAQAMAEENLPKPVQVTVLSTGAVQVRNEALPYPEKATVIGPVKVAPRELPGLYCTWLDLQLPERPTGWRAKPNPDALNALVDQVLEELMATPGNRQVALRGAKRLELGIASLSLPPAEGLAMLGLVPEKTVQAIRAGSGAMDAARDGIALCALYRAHAAALAGKHPFTQQDFDELSELGERLTLTIVPEGSRPAALRRNRQEAQDLSNRLYTLLVLRHQELRKAGYYLFGPELDTKVPSLAARRAAPKAKKPAPAKPAAPAPTPAPTPNPNA